MKFSTQFLTVLAATVTATLAKPSILECRNIFEKKYSTCTGILSEKHYGFYENYCIEFETENCKKFYNKSLRDIYAEIPECKDLTEDEEEIKVTESVIKLYYSFMKFACARDEQGNYCPHSFVNVEKTYDIESLGMKGEEANTIYMEYVNETCKSKKCVDDGLSSIENIKKASSTFPLAEMGPSEEMQLQKISSILKSDTCTAKIGKTSVNGNDNVSTFNANANGNVVTSNGNANGTTNPTNSNTNDKPNATNGNANSKTDEKNGATQVTYSSVLIISLAVVLSVLF